MVKSPPKTPDTDSVTPSESNPSASPSMGSHGWSRIVMAAVLMGALVTVVVRGIYVVTHLESKNEAASQVDTP